MVTVRLLIKKTTFYNNENSYKFNFTNDSSRMVENECQLAKHFSRFVSNNFYSNQKQNDRDDILAAEPQNLFPARL